ncbi:MAG TPA: hypothetical protein VEC11_07395 [Allosphingosinicella sp.]|nr:hypothetical protein [Allosphingosinicella sp.]
MLLKTGAGTLLAAGLCLALRGNNLAVLFFRTQDLAILIAGASLLLLLSWRLPALAPIRVKPAFVVVAAALFALLAAWLGTWLVFGGYALTRDEICADFDSLILATGRLYEAIPPEWQGYSHALMPRFMLPLSPEVGWLSAYLPGNAALRALGQLSIGTQWINPLLAALSAGALYRIGLRLWPGAKGTALIPVLLLVSSAQFLTMAMTSYAMAAHLAVNLLWLWCFLRNDKRGDAGAILFGFLGTGLHQLLFHPLFAFPFLAQLWFAGQRRRALLYLAAYALIGLFWASYWQIVLAGTDAGAGAAGGSGGLSFLIARVLTQLQAIDLAGFGLMALNLARFVSWQNILLLPLALLAWPLIRRGEGVARPLAGGILLTLLAMAILLPWQGHGWGYRYLHGCIGSFCLLAGYGWKALADGPAAARLRGALAAGTLVSLALILPWHLRQAHDFVAPYRAAYAAIRASPAEIVLVDDAGLLFAEDLVRNAPDLSNRPKIVYVVSLPAPQLAALCRSFRVERFGVREGLAFGIPPGGEPDLARAAMLDRLNCGPPVATPRVGR